MSDFSVSRLPAALLRRAAVVVVLVAGIALMGTAMSPIATAAVASRLTHASGCASHFNPYPGSKSTDCVALSNDTAFVDHTVVSAKWSLTADKFGFTNLCAAVTIRNENKTTYFFNDFNMTLRPPNSNVTVLNFTAKHALEDGFIAPGGRATGNICFDYFGQSGQYVAMYSPRANSSIRGIWLVDLS